LAHRSSPSPELSRCSNRGAAQHRMRRLWYSRHLRHSEGRISKNNVKNRTVQYRIGRCIPREKKNKVHQASKLLAPLGPSLVGPHKYMLSDAWTPVVLVSGNQKHIHFSTVRLLHFGSGRGADQPLTRFSDLELVLNPKVVLHPKHRCISLHTTKTTINNQIFGHRTNQTFRE
jgi:hypothetical protein